MPGRVCVRVDNGCKRKIPIGNKWHKYAVKILEPTDKQVRFVDS